MKVIYRLSTNSYTKIRLENATKYHCLENAIAVFGANNIHLLIDDTNLNTEVMTEISPLLLDFSNIVHYLGGSSAASFRYAMKYAIDHFEDEEIVYLCEDDYLHLPACSTAFVEGLERADYLSGYDCIDKYIPASQGGNPLIDDSGGEDTKVILTKSSHWKLTNSTTCTFATTAGQLKRDMSIWEPFISQSYPNDYHAFLELRRQGRTLITPIPSLSSHAEEKWVAPRIDWKQV